MPQAQKAIQRWLQHLGRWCIEVRPFGREMSARGRIRPKRDANRPSLFVRLGEQLPDSRYTLTRPAPRPTVPCTRSSGGPGGDLPDRLLRQVDLILVEGHAAPRVPTRSSSRVRRRANEPDRDLGRPEHFWAGRALKTCGESEATFDPGQGIATSRPESADTAAKGRVGVRRQDRRTDRPPWF